MTAAIALATGMATDVGAVRATNEDSALVGNAVFAVADGMGGHAAGEVASGLVIAHLRELDGHADPKPDVIRARLLAANDAVLDSAREHPERTGMGTTVAGLGLVQVAGSAHWVVFNIGDSRVYRFAGDTLSRLTTDHSEVQELVSAGSLTPQEARTYPRRNVVTRALGTERAPEPDQWVFPPTGGDRFVLCTDGLTTELEDSRIAEVLRRDLDAQSTADELVKLAVEAGGHDNVTVVVVDHLVATDQISDDTTPRSVT